MNPQRDQQRGHRAEAAPKLAYAVFQIALRDGLVVSREKAPDADR
jgi:hypothetical protein